MCTGYGGLDVAVEAHFGAKLAWYSELDKNCSQVLEHHWPGVPNHGDLTKADWSSVEPVDIMCAGFPCQPFSHAGKREGVEDERAIWPIISNAISVLRPSIVVLENVAGLLTLGATGVIADLARLGYDCRWGVIRASEASAAHQRKRWFCIAYSSSVGRGEGSRHLSSHGWEAVRSIGDIEPSRSDKPTAHTTVVGLEGVRPECGLEEESGEPRRLSRFGAYEPSIRRWERAIKRLAPEPVDGKGVASEFVEWMMGLPEGWVTDVIDSRTAQLKMLGNGVVPQQAALALKTLA
jgi:DNA (cytosine-5)-methyltransferase 1